MLPPNSVPLYRILTEKSRIGFGKYADMTVKDVMCIDLQYIVWLYACKKEISLCKELKEKLGLPDIEKPGSNEKVLYEWKSRQSEGYTEDQCMHGLYKIARLKKKRAIGRLIRAERETSFTKGQLKAINHGGTCKEI